MRRPLCVACFFFLLIVRLGLALAGLPENPYAEISGETMTLYGCVSHKERKQDYDVCYLSDVCYVAEDGTLRALGELGLACYLPREEQAEPYGGWGEAGAGSGESAGGWGEAGVGLPPMGATIAVTGRVTLYHTATNPGEFDMQRYYLCKGYGARLSTASWEQVGVSSSRYREALWRLRCYLGSLYDRVLPAQDAGVMRAMALGDKGDLSGDLKELYRANGIVHILAISGLHISILGVGLYRGLRRMSVSILPAAAISVFLMVNYALLVGAGTSTVRAVTMFAILAYADVERRSYDLPTALFLSAAVTVFVNPYELMMSGFWLSYLAVFGIAVFFPALVEGVRLPTKWGQRAMEALAGGAAVTLFTLPLILSGYYEAPLYSVLLNLIVIPLMSVLMGVGIAVLPVAAISIRAGIVLAYPCHLILTLYERLCTWISGLPGSVFIAGAPAAWQVVAAYLLLLSVLLLGRRSVARLWAAARAVADSIPGRMRGQRVATPGALAAGLIPGRMRGQRVETPGAQAADPDEWRRIDLRWLLALRLILCALALVVLLLRPRAPLRVTVLDVGQGDGICIEGVRTVCMIDGGSTSKDSLYTYQLAPFLKHQGIARVDDWFLTHPDIDHTSGLLELLADEGCGIRVSRIVLPAAAGTEADFTQLLALAEARGVEVVYFAAGDVLDDGQLRVESLHPAAGYRCEDVNEYSQVLLLESEGIRGVFTGDATMESEAAVLHSAASGGLAAGDGVDFLKVGHHGSHTSTSQEWLDCLQPRLALISCGYRSVYGHPHGEVLDRLESQGCETHRTDLEGALILTADGARLRLHAYAPRGEP